MMPAAPRRQNPLLLRLQFPTEYGLFVALNLLDVLMTLLAVKHEGAEANAVAAWFISWGGLAAFVAFKLALMGVAVALCEVVGKRRRATARIVLWLGIALVGFVAVTTALRFHRFMQTRF